MEYDRLGDCSPKKDRYWQWLSDYQSDLCTVSWWPWLVSYKLALLMVDCQLSRNTIAYEDWSWVVRFDPSFVLLIKVVIVIQYFGLSSQSVCCQFCLSSTISRFVRSRFSLFQTMIVSTISLLNNVYRLGFCEMRYILCCHIMLILSSLIHKN